MDNTPNVTNLLAEIESLKNQLAEAQLQAQRAHDLDDALTHNSMGTFVWDFTTGIIEEDFFVEVDGKRIGALQALGLKPPLAIEEYATYFADHCVHPTYAYWFKNNFKLDFVNNFAKDGPRKLAFESRLLTEAPYPQYVRYTVPLIRDPQTGHLMGYGVINNVTNRYRIVAPVEFREIDNARQALITALNQVFQLAYYIDLEHDTFDEFVSAEPIHGTISLMDPLPTPREAIQFISMFMHEDHRQTFLEFFDFDSVDARLKGKPCIETDFMLADGRWMRAICVPSGTNHAGSITSVVATVHDVSADRQIQTDLALALEAASRANEAKTSFLFNMSHDIRTPMNALMGYSHLLRKRTDDPVQLDYLNKMDQAGSILMSLINNVLDMARIESGHVKLDSNRLYTGNVVSGIIDVFGQTAAEKNIKLVHSINVEHRNIMCDIVKTREVLTNLVSNAIKYTNPGGTVTITTEELPSNNPNLVTIRTTVADTGVGMSPEFLPHLFEEFTRTESAVNSHIEGTGLGMSIVKKLVDLMGGTIEVESQLGMGTTFALTLQHPLSDAQAETPDTPEAVDTLAFKGKRILLAEDNDLNAEIAEVILKDLGFLVERAHDGQEALEMLEKSSSGMRQKTWTKSGPGRMSQCIQESKESRPSGSS